jgi:hypothetical protein
MAASTSVFIMDKPLLDDDNLPTTTTVHAANKKK